MPMVQHGISVMIFTAVNDATLVVFKNKWIRICCFMAFSFALLQHSGQFSHIIFLSGFIKSCPQKNSFISKKMPSKEHVTFGSICLFVKGGPDGWGSRYGSVGGCGGDSKLDHEIE